jgi:glutaredoxin
LLFSFTFSLCFNYFNLNQTTARGSGVEPATLLNNMQRSAKAHVVIYSRPGCHLCEEAQQAIAATECLDEYTLEEINIESDPDLLRRYQYDIPVITINGVEAFRHRLTSEAFRARLQEEAGASRPSSPRDHCT